MHLKTEMCINDKLFESFQLQNSRASFSQEPIDEFIYYLLLLFIKPIMEKF